MVSAIQEFISRHVLTTNYPQPTDAGNWSCAVLKLGHRSASTKLMYEGWYCQIIYLIAKISLVGPKVFFQRIMPS